MRSPVVPALPSMNIFAIIVLPFEYKDHRMHKHANDAYIIHKNDLHASRNLRRSLRKQNKNNAFVLHRVFFAFLLFVVAIVTIEL